MAASANPSGGNQDVVVSNGNPNNSNNSSSNGGGGGGGGGKSGPDNSATTQALKHTPEPGLAIEWTPEEIAIFDNGLIKFASETPFKRYAHIADLLNDKTLRDVALRVRWMTAVESGVDPLYSVRDDLKARIEALICKVEDLVLSQNLESATATQVVQTPEQEKKESGKRRKDDMTRRNKDKKEKTADPSAKPSSLIAMRPNVPPYAPPMIIADDEDGISFEAIGGSTGQLLAQNAQVFDQISANFATLRVHDNINLFRQTRDNILTIMNELNNDMPGIMKQMPLPAHLRDDLVTKMLGGPSHPMHP